MKLRFNFITLLILLSAYIHSEPSKIRDKMLFMYKNSQTRSGIVEELGEFSYKNIIFKEDQLTLFLSPNQTEEDDETIDISQYAFTIRYSDVDLPCLNKAFVCTYGQFRKEYEDKLTGMLMDVPKEVTDEMGDNAVVSKSCLLIFFTPILNVEEAAWLCHKDKGKLYEFQIALSTRVLAASNKEYSFPIIYVQDQAKKAKGTLTLKAAECEFKDQNNNILFKSDWKDMYHYAMSLHTRECIKWKAPGLELEGDRCFRLIKNSQKKNRNGDIFCVYNTRNLPSDKCTLEQVQSKFLAAMYTNKINLRLIKILSDLAVDELAKKKKTTININSNLLDPIKINARFEYLRRRHIAIIKFNQDNNKQELTTALENLLDDVTSKVCDSNELCMNALGFAVAKGILPLDEKNKAIATDIENPYLILKPKENYKIEVSDKKSKTRAILNAFGEANGLKNYYAEPAGASSRGVPSALDVTKAINTIRRLDEKKPIKSIDELKPNCRMDNRNAIKNVKRKIGLLMYSSKVDIFFDYLGNIRNWANGRN